MSIPRHFCCELQAVGQPCSCPYSGPGYGQQQWPQAQSYTQAQQDQTSGYYSSTPMYDHGPASSSGAHQAPAPESQAYHAPQPTYTGNLSTNPSTMPAQGSQVSYTVSSNPHVGGLPSPPATSSTADDQWAQPHGGTGGYQAQAQQQPHAAYDDRSTYGQNGSYSEDDQRVANSSNGTAGRPGSSSTQSQRILNYNPDHEDNATNTIADFNSRFFGANDANRNGSSSRRLRRSSKKG